MLTGSQLIECISLSSDWLRFALLLSEISFTLLKVFSFVLGSLIFRFFELSGFSKKSRPLARAPMSTDKQGLTVLGKQNCFILTYLRLYDYYYSDNKNKSMELDQI